MCVCVCVHCYVFMYACGCKVHYISTLECIALEQKPTYKIQCVAKSTEADTFDEDLKNFVNFFHVYSHKYISNYLELKYSVGL